MLGWGAAVRRRIIAAKLSIPLASGWERQNGASSLAMLATLVVAVAAALVAAGSGVAEASNGASALAVGGRAAGRGGADTAIGDDALSFYLNPAGLGLLGRFRADAQDMLLISRDRFVNTLNDSEDTQSSYLLPSLGLAVDPYWGEPAEVPLRLAFGVAGVHGAGGVKTVYTSIYPEGTPEEMAFSIIRVGPAVEAEPSPGFRIGIGMYYNYLDFSTKSASTSSEGNSNGRVRVHRNPDGTINDPPRDFLVDGQPVTWNEIFALGSSPDSNSAARYVLENATSNGFSFNLGVQFDATDWLTLGLAYVSPTFFFAPLRGKARIDASKALEAIQADADIQTILGPVLDAYLPGGQNADLNARYDYELDDFTSPQIVSIGVAVYPHERFSLALDLRWMQWSETFSTFKVKLAGGTNPNINEINGSDEIQSSVALRWSDIFVVGVGATVAPIDELTLRIGYNFSSDPLPGDDIGPGATAFLMHHITFGGSIAIWDGFGATLACVYALPRQMEVGRHRSNAEYSNSSFAADQGFVYIGFSLDL